MALNDMAIRKAKPREKPYKLADGGGLHLHIQPSGGKLWRQKYRINGTERKLSIGTYPDISLSEARKRRDAAREQLFIGKDPHWQRSLARETEGEVAQHDAVNGNARSIADVPLPGPIGAFLCSRYGSPPKCIGYIDDIRERSGVNTCPMCGSMHVGTLDHVLPKTYHPAFAIFGLNLAPACKCNMLRSTRLVGPLAGERVLHPYVDDVLAERILAARFDHLGAIPRLSVRLVLDPSHPDHAAVRFHAATVVERTQIKDYLCRLWTTLVQKSSSLTADLRFDPVTLADLIGILERELERLDGFHSSKNNRNSVFAAGLLDAHVVEWLFERFTRPGPVPDATLLQRMSRLEPPGRQRLSIVPPRATGVAELQLCPSYCQLMSTHSKRSAMIFQFSGADLLLFVTRSSARHLWRHMLRHMPPEESK
ncbi:hypothetical protein BH10PSE12_BH10PSE12_23550 [soil metagenome]